MEYLKALENGTIVPIDSSLIYLDNDELVETVEEALSLYSSSVTVSEVEGQSDVYQFEIPYKQLEREASSVEESINFLFILKNATPGGRTSLRDEQRIQPKAGIINYIHSLNNNSNSFILAIYKQDNEEPIFCTWKSTSSSARDSNPVSKQIKVDTISKAYKYGFAQQLRGSEFTCAFRKEFLVFYLRNLSWIHDANIQEMNDIDNIDLDEDDSIYEVNEPYEINYQSNLDSTYKRNRILFGAPGTGKSFELNKDKDNLLKNGGYYERVTFHPDYSYANFVGTYKPIPGKDKNGEEIITYSYVPGPFMRTFVRAMENILNTEKHTPHLLIIEEINRSNTAAVFGDIFQLLDRKDNISEYPIQVTEDMKDYLVKSLGGSIENYNEIKIPDNMFLWATMNSADQGVFPIDTAFKRRWDFNYLGINTADDKIANKYVVLGKGSYKAEVEWNQLRKEINNALTDYGINEDKLLGPYFININTISKDEDLSTEKEKYFLDRKEFTEIFKNKVIMYLYEDAAKQRQKTLFAGVQKDKRYSTICSEFDRLGVSIFEERIVQRIKLASSSTEGVEE